MGFNELEGKPNTDAFAKELIDTGFVFEGYMLVYARQIRDLLVTLYVLSKPENQKPE
jgi:hypothetical protein